MLKQKSFLSVRVYQITPKRPNTDSAKNDSGMTLHIATHTSQHWNGRYMAVYNLKKKN